MIEYTVNVRGVPAVMKTLDGLERLETGLSSILGEWATETLDGDLYGMANYAPPPPNSTYVRTGRLGSNWGLRRNGRLSVVFENATDYAGYVVGNNDGAGQAGIHAGRWWIARKKIETKIQKLKARVERHVADL